MNQNSKQRTNLISKIHIAKKQLNMDDDTYRAFLSVTVKKASCAGMSFSELHQVVEALKKKGFKVKPKASTAKNANKKMSPVSKGRRIDKLRAIWITMAKAGHLKDGSETALLSWTQGEVIKQGGIPVDSLEWLESQGKILNKVLEQLKRWQARVEKRAVLGEEVGCNSAAASKQRLTDTNW
ncbi:MAG: regulatory protein GemA [Oleispira sp.]|nr:regulatory protein GemA [Oleispira sp.]